MNGSVFTNLLVLSSISSVMWNSEPPLVSKRIALDTYWHSLGWPFIKWSIRAREHCNFPVWAWPYKIMAIELFVYVPHFYLIILRPSVLIAPLYCLNKSSKVPFKDQSGIIQKCSCICSRWQWFIMNLFAAHPLPTHTHTHTHWFYLTATFDKDTSFRSFYIIIR